MHWSLPSSQQAYTTRFDQIQLQQASKSTHFVEQQTPFTYYFGYQHDTQSKGVPDTISFATAGIRDDIKGYAGPVNLLVSVNREGELLNVNYLESSETPSYISEIENWLDTLTGFALKDGPLTLDKVDGLTGATVTSKAVIGAINQTVTQAYEEAYEQPLFSTAEAS